MRDTVEFESWLSGLLNQLSPGQRKELAVNIAQRLRKSNQQRIADQISPDGTPFSQRLRQKKGHIKRRTMFGRLRTNKWMKASGTAEEAVVEFIGSAERIAKVHHFGLRDRVRPRGPEHTYAARPLLGLSEQDIADIENAVISHASARR